MSKIVQALGMAKSVSIFMKCLAVFAFALAGLPDAHAQTPALKFPVRIEQSTEYENAAYDVGIAIVAGQPREATLRKLKEQGYRVVVNFRTQREMDDREQVPFDEEALLKELGIKYLHLPIGGSTPARPECVDKLAEAMKGNEGKVLVHCTVAWRASYVWTAYIHKYRNIELSEAVRHGQSMQVSRFLESLLGTDIQYRLAPTPAPSAGPPPAPSSAADWKTIITPKAAAELQASGAAMLDVRANYMEYIDGHLPGAVHMDANALRGAKLGLPVQYRTDAEMVETLRLSGVRTDLPVVVYANPGDILNATMSVYVLEKLGAKKIAIVDGGSAAGTAAGLIVKEIPVRNPGNFRAADGPNITATLEDIRQNLQSKKATLIDARPPAQYSGEQNLWVRNGHIPGAINVFWRTLTREENAHAFRSKAEIEQIFKDKGIRPDQDVIVYCGTSKEATLIWMVLKRELGYAKVRVFEGAWTEYANRSDLPVAKGSNPG